ncbi:MAG TPA: mechanosensitive ion channel domain-containing protein [Candidatus Saccharimonadales bacterium]|nr:mechanosensitive ion channel domain-containing protein [Candidatus Saccharimonadales bacterium]
MKSKQRSVALVLVLLLIASVFALVRTRTSQPAFLAPTTTQVSNPAEPELVDQGPLQTAQQFAKMPTAEEEKPFAQEALEVGDKEMDLAFAAAVLDAQQHPPVLTPQAKAIQARLQKAEDAADADKKRVDALTAADAKATGSKKDALDVQLDAAKAQLELDQDEVDEAKQDLSHAGGDPQGRIQAMLDQHEAASHSSDTTKVTVSEPPEVAGLIHRFQRWSALHQKQLKLWRAKQEAESEADSLAAKQVALKKEISDQKLQGGQPAPPAPGQAGTKEESAAIAKTTRLRAGDQKALTILGKRINNERQLAEVYGNWISVVAAKQRAVLNRAMIGVTIILGILLIGVFFDGWLEHLLGKTSLDRRQVETLRTVTRVSLQIFAVLFILLVILGPPSQLGTFLGLAGAGLTVALKDFIVGFLGWFVLMGKNGIRLGDWVEINGVTGEVVELGMFHTVLLETGNWTDSSHPTGRRVTFTNSFAIEGHYFNFSTSGQWLWDELQIVVPAGQDPYPIVAAIQKKVVETTSEGALQAEKEWKGTTKSGSMSAKNAAPAINVKPVVGGIEIAVRYITRANERYQLRAKLYEAAVALMGQKSATPVQEKVMR